MIMDNLNSQKIVLVNIYVFFMDPYIVHFHSYPESTYTMINDISPVYPER